jgi:hypothetical protein
MVVGSNSSDEDEVVPRASVAGPAPATKTVQFIPWGTLDLELLKSSLRVEHLQQNL